jgi:hypothetical protein
MHSRTAPAHVILERAAASQCTDLVRLASAAACEDDPDVDLHGPFQAQTPVVQVLLQQSAATLQVAPVLPQQTVLVSLGRAPHEYLSPQHRSRPLQVVCRGKQQWEASHAPEQQSLGCRQTWAVGAQAHWLTEQTPLQQESPPALHESPLGLQARHWPPMHSPLQQSPSLAQAPLPRHTQVPPAEQSPLQQSEVAPHAPLKATHEQVLQTSMLG